MKKVKNKKTDLVKISILFWIAVFVLYGTIFGPLVKDIPSWPIWVKIVVTIVTVLTPLTVQVLIVFKNVGKAENI